MPIRNRLDVPRWFGPEDGKFLREHITEEVWERIKLAHGKEAILDFCAEKGIPLKDVGMYWIKSPEYSVMVKGMKSEVGNSQEEIFQLIAEKLGDYQIPTFQFAADGLQQKCAILNLYDAHLDKIALAAETGESSTIEDNVRRYHEGFDTLLNSVLAHDPEVIIFPLGNDFYHANDMTGKTKKGTQIQYLASPEEAYSIVSMVAIDCIYKLAQTGARIIVPFVKGNHDEDNITILGFWLNQVFKDVKNVEFLPGREQRRYFQYGKNLFGFAHGDKEKNKINHLPILMAQERPKEWADTKYRVWYCGDLHHQFEYEFLRTKDQIGVQVKFLRSVGTSDAYHTDHGWIGVPKTGYAEIYKLDGGRCAGFEVNL